jgi:hypothetical protein
MRIKLLLAGLAELSLALLFGSGILTTMCFIGAVTPEQGLRKGYPPMPAHWEAGFWNHGSYVQWLNIWEHPFLFALSVSSLIIGAFGLQWVQRRWTFQLGERTEEKPAPAGSNAVILISLIIFSVPANFVLRKAPQFFGMPASAAWQAISLVGAVILCVFGAKLYLHWKTRQ